MRKLALFSLAFSGAIFLSHYLLPLFILLPLVGICLIAVLVGFFLRGALRLRVLLLCFGFLFGFLYYRGYTNTTLVPAEALAENPVPVIATALDFPEETEYGARLLVQICDPAGFSCKALLYLDSADGISPGDFTESLTGRFRPANISRNESITYYTARGILLIIYPDPEIIWSSPEHIPLSVLPIRFANRLRQTITELFAPAEAAFLHALVTGQKSGLSDDFTLALSRTGLSHVVAISGMHVSFLSALLFSLIRNRKLASLVCLPLLFFFMVMTGMSPSVVRAGIMLLFVLSAPLLGRESDPITSLAFSLFLLLLQNPFCCASVGLQLSFAATAGLLLFSPRIYRALDSRLPHPESRQHKKRRHHRSPFTRFFLATLTATVCASVFTVPLTALYFGSFSLIAPVANLLTLWAISILFSGSLISALFGTIFLPFGLPIALFLTPLLRYLLWLISFLSKLPYAALPMGSHYITLFLLGVYLLFLALLLFPSGSKKLRTSLACCVSLLIFCLFCARLEYRTHPLSISVLDVGTGQSIALLSQGHTALVDCGGENGIDAGDAAADLFASAGHTTLDYLILTHYHKEHTNGVARLFSRMNIQTVILPDFYPSTPAREAILSLASKAGSEVRFLTRPENISLGSATLSIYDPLGSGIGQEAGLSLRVSSGEFALLITGDMDYTIERRLLKYFPQSDIDVLIAGRHGDSLATSDSLLQAVTPEAVIISCGYHFSDLPSEETLLRCSAIGSAVYRTDECGTITIRT